MRWTWLALCVGAVGCELVEDPCERFVDYMCTCHDGDYDTTCEDYEDTFLTGVMVDVAIQNECSIGLDTQQRLDDENGLDCGV